MRWELFSSHESDSHLYFVAASVFFEEETTTADMMRAIFTWRHKGDKIESGEFIVTWEGVTDARAHALRVAETNGIRWMLPQRESIYKIAMSLLGISTAGS